MMKDRVSFVKELWDVCSFFFVAPAEYDEKTVKNAGKKIRLNVWPNWLKYWPE